MNLLLISQREGVNVHGDSIDSLESSYVDFFSLLGYTVLAVPNCPESVDDLFALPVSAVALSGGGILQQYAYDFQKDGYRQDKRDFVEDRLIAFAIDKNLPLFGICRGMQKINAYFGGKTSTFDKLSVPRPVRELHQVVIEGKTISVNSYHRDGIFLQGLAESLKPLAMDIENGVIEAFVRDRILGVQWHPERMIANQEGNEIAKVLIKKINKL